MHAAVCAGALTYVWILPVRNQNRHIVPVSKPYAEIFHHAYDTARLGNVPPRADLEDSQPFLVTVITTFCLGAPVVMRDQLMVVQTLLPLIDRWYSGHAVRHRGIELADVTPPYLRRKCPLGF